VGNNNTEETLHLSRWASDQGVSGLLVVTPYYNKPSQSGLLQHYQMIADSVQCEVVLYQVPGRTGVCLTAETIAKLASHPRIKSLKEASGSVAFASEILSTVALSGHSIDLLSGEDGIYLPLLSIGAVGVISVASNLIPKAMVALQKAMQDGKPQEALRIHQHYYPLFRDLFVESNPVPIKYALSFIGCCEPQVRLPLAPLMLSSIEKLELSLQRCGIKKGVNK
jgi:4-hydroxy-tetrahydrodipicolinate synthase